LCKVWLAYGERLRCSNEAKTRNRLKFAGVPQTRKPISAVSRPKFTILRRRLDEVLLFNRFFPIVDTCLHYEDTALQSCAMVPRWQIFVDFLHPVFSASRAQYISDLHSEFALRPHRVWKCACNLRRLRLGEEKKKKEERRNHRVYI